MTDTSTVATDIEVILREMAGAWPEAAGKLRVYIDELRSQVTRLNGANGGEDLFENLRAANVARDVEWNTGHEKITLAFRGAELAGECGEACNIIKKLERERIGMKGSRATNSELADELADVVIATDQAAMHQGIDLRRAVQDKFNATSEKYGFKTRLTIGSGRRI